MTELSLFTGVGGGLLGSKILGWRTIGAVEHDRYCCRVLEQRQRDGWLEPFPIWHMDIRDFNRQCAPWYTGMADIVTAGFPCQPFSAAGKRAGAEDDRNMWPATIECVRLVRPRYVYMENVPGLLSSGYFGTILGDLAESGYDARWRILSAAELGAPHRRDRLWIVAYAKGSRWPPVSVYGHTNFETDIQEWCQQCSLLDVKEMGVMAEPGKRGTDYALADWVDRLKAIGNGQVPQVMAAAWKLLTETSL